MGYVSDHSGFSTSESQKEPNACKAGQHGITQASPRQGLSLSNVACEDQTGTHRLSEQASSQTEQRERGYPGLMGFLTQTGAF